MTVQEIHRVRVARVEQQTPDAITIVLDVGQSPKDRFDYRAGQFLTFKVQTGDGSFARCYSLCSAPEFGEDPTVAVRRVPGGMASNWLCDNVVPGSELEVLSPSGSFGPSTYNENLLLFAAGSGITPIISIVKSLLTQSQKDAVLFYVNRDAESVMFAGQLHELSNKYGARLTVHNWLTAKRGRPTAEVVAGIAAAHRTHAVYACGPEGFVEVVQSGLNMTNPRRSARVERFVSLARNPFEDDLAPPVPISGIAGTVTVNLGHRQWSLQWPVGTTLLALLLQHGIDVPYACEEGTCGSCECRVVTGTVGLLYNEVLDDAALASGAILACQAIPQGGQVRVTYE